MSFSFEENLCGNYFQEVMSAQTEMVMMYLDDLDNPLIFSQYCGNTMAPLSFTLVMMIMPPPITLYFF